MTCFTCGYISHIPGSIKGKENKLDNQQKKKKRKIDNIRNIADKEMQKKNTPVKSNLLNLLNSFNTNKKRKNNY